MGVDSRVGVAPQVEVGDRNNNGVQMATKAGQIDIRNIIMVVRHSNLALKEAEEGVMLTKEMVEVTFMRMELVLEITRITTRISTKDRTKMDTTTDTTIGATLPRTSLKAMASAKEGAVMVKAAGEILGEQGPPIVGPSRIHRTAITISLHLMVSKTHPIHPRTWLTEICLVRITGTVVFGVDVVGVVGMAGMAGMAGVVTSARPTTSRMARMEVNLMAHITHSVHH